MPDVSILVVEDEPAVAEVVSLYLRRAGYSVRVASTGQAALREIDHQPPALIILDLMLPEVDGLEVCKMLRRDASTAAIPILMLTAKAAEIDRVLGLELGADDYVTKPFSPRELVARVKRILARGAAQMGT